MDINRLSKLLDKIKSSIDSKKSSEEQLLREFQLLLATEKKKKNNDFNFSELWSWLTSEENQPSGVLKELLNHKCTSSAGNSDELSSTRTRFLGKSCTTCPNPCSNNQAKIILLQAKEEFAEFQTTGKLRSGGVLELLYKELLNENNKK